MDIMARMKLIRMIEKMNECPVMSRKLGLKDISYLKIEKEPVRKNDRHEM